MRLLFRTLCLLVFPPHPVAFFPPHPVPWFALDKPSRLVAKADALLGIVNIDLVLPLLLLLLRLLLLHEHQLILRIRCYNMNLLCTAD
jgi:hypothetical protein